MQKSIALFVNSTYILDFSKRNLNNICLVEKSLWKSSYPKFVIRIMRNLNFFSIRRALNIKRSEKYDVAIIADTEMTPKTLEYISRYPIANKQYIYLWNKVSQKTRYIINKAPEAGIVVQTYNLSDAKKYGIRYHQQCWNSDFIDPIDNTVDYDMVFLGNEKGRYELLVQLLKFADLNCITTNFVIVSQEKKPYTTVERVDYSQYIKNVKRSKAVVDIVTKDNYGLTYRPLEAIFLRKKLITNYKEIIEYDFYEPYKNNIFIIGQRNFSELRRFLSDPFDEVQVPINKYDIENWLLEFVE